MDRSRHHKIAALLFLSLPLLSVCLGIITPIAFLIGRLLGDALTNGSQQFHWSYIENIMFFTVWQAGVSTLVTAALACVVAYIYSRFRFWGKHLLLNVGEVAFFLPSIVVAFGFILIYGQNGYCNRFLIKLGLLTEPLNFLYHRWAIVAAHVFFNVAFVARSLANAWRDIPDEQRYWSQVLGLSRWNSFFSVDWPYIKRPLINGSLLVFVLCLHSFAIVMVLGGGVGATTAEVGIYQFLHADFDIPQAMLLAAFQLIVTFAGSVLFSLPLASAASPFLPLAAIRNKDSALPSLASSPFFLPVAVFLLVFSLFIALPLLALMLDGIIALQSILTELSAFWELIGEPLLASIFISSSSALLTIMLALMAAIGLFHLGKFSGNGALACERSFFLVLGISPVVLSLAYFVFFQPILSFSGITLWIIIAIQSIGSLAFAIKSLVQSVMITKKNCELFAQVMGLPGWKQFFITELPGMLPALGTAFLVSFALSLSNLSVIAMFSQSRIETIPLLIYRLMAVYRYPEAAVLSIGLALFCLGALWAKWRLERRMFTSSHLG